MTAAIDKIRALVESSADPELMEQWGRKRLAYEINDQTEGYYILMHFSSEPEFPKELERVLRITDGVLRQLVIRRDA